MLETMKPRSRKQKSTTEDIAGDSVKFVHKRSLRQNFFNQRRCTWLDGGRGGRLSGHCSRDWAGNWNVNQGFTKTGAKVIAVEADGGSS